MQNILIVNMIICILALVEHDNGQESEISMTSSIFTGGVMMTLFWYYRPEEAVGIQSADFQKVF